MLTSKNSAPSDSICSFTAGLTSNPLTTAPILLAVPMAARPATPPPITSTLAGGTLPAAVICPVNNTQKQAYAPYSMVRLIYAWRFISICRIHTIKLYH